jgi:hypothetical protein
MPAFSPTLADRLLAPGNFFVAPFLDLRRTGPADETIPWEVFRGRLLDGSQTRLQRAFVSWDVYLIGTGAPGGGAMLSLKFDSEGAQVHVVRGMLAHVWEGYAEEENVILSRENLRWVRELVATVRLEDFRDESALETELAGALFGAVVGLSRLPLTSVESPLPDFSLGRFGYFFNPGTCGEPMRSACDLLSMWTPGCPQQEEVKRLEVALRATPAADAAALAAIFAERRQTVANGRDFQYLLRQLINDVSLTPFTGFVETLLAFVPELVTRDVLTPAAEIDFYGWILRQIVRHLSAYDLITFHHRGANYPDALVLDAVLKRYLQLIETRPALFLNALSDTDADRRSRRIRRRALHQGILLRKFYEGHPVPDAPTSPGENARVLPPPHVRVPEEQITQVHRRRKLLYDDDPLDQYISPAAGTVLDASIDDLREPAELAELGMAIFIDRPMGAAKAPGEPDQTLLFSHEAFSRALALRRLDSLARAAPASERFPWEEYRRSLLDLPANGIPAANYRNAQHGVVSLADVFRAGEDFVLLRTTPGTVREFLRQFPMDALAEEMDLGFLFAAKDVLILPDPSPPPGGFPRLIVYDGQLRQRLVLEIDLSRGSRCRSGREFPAAGLRVLASPP